MADPISDALDRLQQYAAAHPEHDTDVILQHARTVLSSARRGVELLELAHPAQPAPPAEGEAAELAAEIRHFLAGYQQFKGRDPECIYSINSGGPMEAHIRVSRLARIAELLPRLVEARDAFTSLRNEILHGLDGFDPDQTNAVLDVIDNHTPDWV